VHRNDEPPVISGAKINGMAAFLAIKDKSKLSNNSRQLFRLKRGQLAHTATGIE
jgi:hypothetical protein